MTAMKPAPDFDARLAELRAAQKPGETFRLETIAQFCGVSHQRVSQIERLALAKLRLLPDVRAVAVEYFAGRWPAKGA